MRERTAWRCFAFVFACLLLAPPARGDEAPDGSLSAMRGRVERYAADAESLGQYLGRTFSNAGRDRTAAFLGEQLKSLEGVDFNSLDQAGKIDWLLLRNKLQFEQKQLDREKKVMEATAPMVPFADAILGLHEARRRMEEIDSPKAAQTLTDLTALVAKTRKALESQAMEAPSNVTANRAARRADALRSNLRQWNTFYAGYDPTFTWWMKRPYADADKALEDYAGFLRKKFAGYGDSPEAEEPVIGDPIGREALLDALQNELIPYTPEELLEIAEKEFAWCEAEMKRAADDLGCNGDWHKALDLVSQKRMPPGEQPKLIRELAEEAVKFVEDRNLVTVPPLCKEVWRMEMMSPERQKVNPYFTGGETISVSYPTDSMTQDDKMMSLRGNNRAFCRATVQHELIPGHHLQLFMADRYNAHRKAFSTPFIVEGWALYWEMLLWDKGFPQTAEDRVGMLFWRSHRCARIIFSIKFHLGQMTAPEAIDFLVEHIGHERRNATAEVRRSVAGAYGPLYQAAYMLGGLQIRAMRHELVDSGRMTDRQFHDAILRENAIPVEMIRASLTNQPLTRDFKSTWRFYDAPKVAEKTGEAPRAQRGRPRVDRDRVEPHWLSDGKRFWYRNDLVDGGREFVFVDAERGERRPAFDSAKVAQALGDQGVKEVSAEKLPIDALEYADDGKSVRLIGSEKSWRLDLESGALSAIEADATKDAVGLTAEADPRPSRRTGPESAIEFVNETKEEAKIFWLDADGGRQPFGVLQPGERRRQHTYGGHVWLATKADGATLGVFEAKNDPSAAVITGKTTPRRPRRERRRESDRVEAGRSPDGKWETFVRDHNLWLRGAESKEEFALTKDGSAAETYGRNAYREQAVEMNEASSNGSDSRPEVYWAPDSSHLVAMRTHAVAGRTVHLIESSPKDQLQPKLHSFPYLKPGDDVPYGKPHLFDVAGRAERPIKDELFNQPWEIGEVRWAADSSRFTFLYNQRGHQALRIIAVDASSGEAKAIVDETSKTFIDYSGKQFKEYLDDTHEIIWMSERDGWNHLYLYDAEKGEVKNQITRGEWVVREVLRADREKRQVWFYSGGVRPGQDPYYAHLCRVNFDGSGFIVLSEGDGTHRVDFSPSNDYFVDVWSRVDQTPATELRRSSDGTLACKLEQADAEKFQAGGGLFPERFVAKGRDGETDIYGIVYKPRSFDPSRKYPVIESIYAGPQGAFVPKTFAAERPQQRLADRGFVVVQIDGMGTSERSKKFHDVCWKNLADAGFPDRIAWMKAAAKDRPYMDLSRVGVYGGSAGGQNALGALLFHGDFYKVAAADCGCHDNRMDKIWWNEQWMGWPIGPEYEASSNVVNAAKLQGKLLLMVGEMDRNVDPASTMQVVNALIKADKDFDLIVFPGANHGAGGSEYGRRRMVEFFLRNLVPPSTSLGLAN